MTARGAAVLVGLGLALGVPTAARADARSEARSAYDRGVEARKRGDLHRAAEELARADALVPHPAALQAALDAAVEADDPVLGEELVARSQREPPPPPLAASVTAAHLKFNGRAGRVRALCPPSGPCLAKLDGRAIEAGTPVWTTTGAHVVTFVLGGAPQNRPVDVVADAITDVPATAKEVAPAPRRDVVVHHGDGLPPLVTWVGISATVGLVAATTFVAIDGQRTHDAFEAAGCSTAANAGCADLHDDGVRRQTAANVLLASTLLVAAGTAVIALVLTDWKPRTVATF